MYSQRQATPPMAVKARAYGSADSGNTMDSAYYSLNSSPDSFPDPLNASPIRQFGPLLLPKIRAQDQFVEGLSDTSEHRRSASANASINHAANLTPYVAHQVPSFTRSVSPSEQAALVSPVTLISPVDSLNNSSAAYALPQSSHGRRQSIQVCRSRSGSVSNRHSRAESVSSVEAVLGRYGYPTYRGMPSYKTSGKSATPEPPVAVTAASHTFNYFDPNFSLQPKPSSLLQIPQPQVSGTDLGRQVSHVYSDCQYTSYYEPTETTFDAFQQLAPTSTLMDYLSSSNPPLDLVRRTNAAGANKHFWWDIRNVRKWNDFSVENIKAVPGLMDLLNIPISTELLPTPQRPNLRPDSEAALHAIWRDVYAAKVNAALSIAQGEKHMAMHAQPRGAYASKNADFVANYQHDTERTIIGDSRRGRIVGIVKTYHSWNSGMRSDLPSNQVYYLHGLAHIHRLMREHGCRYGFIATEIELVCVRCGVSGDFKNDMAKSATATNTGSGGIPLFGFLELSAPIRVAEEGRDGNGDPKMTVGLALWYLHMLAKENRLPGCPLSWKMDVGLPSALTRQHFMERDVWIPKPQLGEQRTAKRLRGWVWPSEPLHRREVKEFSKTRARR